MMKKRNVAIAMAAVTMAGTVAPVVANAAQQKTTTTTKDSSITTNEYSSLESQLKAVAGLKYTSDDLAGVTTNNLVYNMMYSTPTTTNQTLKDTTDFETLARAISQSARGDEFTVTVTDNGNAKDSKGKITNKGNVKLDQDKLYELKQTNFTNITTNGDLAMANFAKQVNSKDNYKNLNIQKANNLSNYLSEKSVDASTGAITLKFKTPKENKMTIGTDNREVIADFTLTLKSGEDKLDFSMPKFSKDKLVGFEKAVEKINPVKYVVKIANIIKESMDVNGKDANTVAKELDKKYKFKTVTKDKIKKVDGKFQLTLEVTHIKLSRSADNSSDKVIKQVILKANTKAELEAIVDAINNTADFTQIVGKNRMDTAIKISEKYYNTSDSNNDAKKAVVLVNELSIVDGLSAAPLAAQKDAPVLLTKSDKLPAEVKAEIIRVMGLQNGVGAAKTVYIVGGTSVVSEDIVKELEAMGLTVKRLAGLNRETTSVAVAKELGVTDKAYVVDGYKGIADAMSISPVAARDGKPVIVVNGQKDLNEDVKKTLKTMTSSEIIGGTSVVTKETERQIESAVISTIDRTAGINRQDTNAEVIKKHYSNVNNLFVAKDGMDREDRLVDALAIAPVAGREKAPVVLNTNSLTTEQALAIDRAKGTNDKTLTQVGGGVAETVITQIKKVLGMK